MEKTVRIPKGLDIYAVKGLVAKLFDVERPLKLKLIWETGEWDPVAGFDEEVGNSDDDEDDDDDDQQDEEGEGNKDRAKTHNGDDAALKNAVDDSASIGKKTGGKKTGREGKN